MSFIKLDIKDRIVQFPNRYDLVPVEGYENRYDIMPANGTVIEPGTPINKALLQRYEDGLDALIHGNNLHVEVITTSGTWTVPENVHFVDLILIGGGGGGGGGYSGGSGSDGGGGGGGGSSGAVTFYEHVKVTPGQEVPIIIGAGGNGGNGESTGSATAGSDGGSTQFLNTYLTSQGGKGGNRGDSSNGGLGGRFSTSNPYLPLTSIARWSYIMGGSGGSDSSRNGEDKNYAFYICPLGQILVAGGAGGGSYNGGVGGTSPTGGNGGTPRTNPHGGNAYDNTGGGGGGGAGDVNNQIAGNGGNGGSGLCIIIY